MYAEGGEDLLVYVRRSSEKVWWRNLEDAANVRLRLRGEDVEGTGHAVPGNEDLCARYLDRFPKAGKWLSADPAPTFVRRTDLVSS